MGNVFNLPNPNVHMISSPNVHQTDIGGFGGQDGGQQQLLPDLSDLFKQTGSNSGGGSVISQTNSVFSYQPLLTQDYERMR